MALKKPLTIILFIVKQVQHLSLRQWMKRLIPAECLEKTDYASDMWLIWHRRPPVESQHYFQFSIPRQWPLCRRPACTATTVPLRTVALPDWLMSSGSLWHLLEFHCLCAKGRRGVGVEPVSSLHREAACWSGLCTVQWNREGSASNLNLTVWHTFVH